MSFLRLTPILVNQLIPNLATVVSLPFSNSKMSRRPSQNKNKFGKFSSFGLENESKAEGPIKKWKTGILSFGSNAFGQIHNSEIMCSTPQLTQLPNDKSPEELPHVTHLAAGNTMTIAVIARKKIYVWGSGVGSYRLPTLLKLSEKFVVSQISCGESHAALVASNGKVYSWGSGEHGALGHGNKQNQTTPKLVTALANLRTVSVSCGHFHTAFVAGPEDEISYINVPSQAASSDLIFNGQGEGEEQGEEADDGNLSSVQNGNTLICASLYSCGLGKAGQLGNGQSIAMIRTPQLVSWFVDNGYKIAQASCGMHHTVVLCVPVHAVRVFMTHIFTFGWGEHGRLGLGNEEGVFQPTMVQFPEPFHGIHISAGEQHTLATSGRIGGCYAWGNNEFGQCGVGVNGSSSSLAVNQQYAAITANPNSSGGAPGGGATAASGAGASGAAMTMCLFPMKVALPEGVRARRVCCGGRHSAILSADYQIFIWGWGEEGQLGNGTEKDSKLPKPCRLPSVIMGISSQTSIKAIDLSLGMCHTVILTQNLEYRPIPKETSLPQQPAPAPAPVTQPQEREEQQEQEEKEQETETEAEVVIEPPPPPIEIPIEAEPEPVVIERLPVITPVEVIRKEGILETLDVQEPPPVITPVPIRSLKDILSAREERKEKNLTSDYLSVLEKYTNPLPAEEDQQQMEKTVSGGIVGTIIVEETAVAEEEQQQQGQEQQPKRRGSGSGTGNMQQYFYRDGQNLDSCYVANTAKRAEIRKMRKASQETAEPTSKTSKPSNPKTVR